MSSLVSSIVEGVVTKNGVRNFGANGHSFTVVPYSGTEKPAAEGQKGEPRPPVYVEATFFGDLPEGIVPGARVAVGGYVFKSNFTRKDGSQGEQVQVKAFQVEALDPAAQTNVTLVGRVGRDGVKALGSGKTFVVMPYGGKDKAGKFLPGIYVDAKCFGIEVDVQPGAVAKVVGTLSQRTYKRADGSTGIGYDLMAKSVEQVEAPRNASGNADGAAGDSSLGYDEDMPVF